MMLLKKQEKENERKQALQSPKGVVSFDQDRDSTQALSI